MNGWKNRETWQASLFFNSDNCLENILNTFLNDYVNDGEICGFDKSELHEKHVNFLKHQITSFPDFFRDQNIDIFAIDFNELADAYIDSFTNEQSVLLFDKKGYDQRAFLFDFCDSIDNIIAEIEEEIEETVENGDLQKLSLNDYVISQKNEEHESSTSPSP